MDKNIRDSNNLLQQVPLCGKCGVIGKKLKFHSGPVFVVSKTLRKIPVEEQPDHLMDIPFGEMSDAEFNELFDERFCPLGCVHCGFDAYMVFKLKLIKPCPTCERQTPHNHESYLCRESYAFLGKYDEEMETAAEKFQHAIGLLSEAYHISKLDIVLQAKKETEDALEILFSIFNCDAEEENTL